MEMCHDRVGNGVRTGTPIEGRINRWGEKIVLRINHWLIKFLLFGEGNGSPWEDLSGGINPPPTINPTLEKGTLFGAFYQPDHGPQKPLSPELAPRVTPSPRQIKSKADFPSPGLCAVASSMAQMLRGSGGTQSPS